MGFSSAQKPFRQRNRIILLRILAAFAATVMIVCRPSLSETSSLHDLMEVSGLLFISTGVFGRLWSILYIGNKKNASLVTSGPYSVTRNPLYFFSTIAVIGVGLFYGSIALAAILGAGSYFVFRHTAKMEESYLREAFGKEYQVYARTVPLFWPAFRLFTSEREVTVSIRALAITLRDAVYFILVYPALELLEYLHVREVAGAMFLLP